MILYHTKVYKNNNFSYFKANKKRRDQRKKPREEGDTSLDTSIDPNKSTETESLGGGKQYYVKIMINLHMCNNNKIV